MTNELNWQAATEKGGKAGLEKRGAWKGLRLGSLAGLDGKAQRCRPRSAALPGSGGAWSVSTDIGERRQTLAQGRLMGKVQEYGGGCLATVGGWVRE